jgi:hypothetical protein
MLGDTQANCNADHGIKALAAFEQPTGTVASRPASPLPSWSGSPSGKVETRSLRSTLPAVHDGAPPGGAHRQGVLRRKQKIVDAEAFISRIPRNTLSICRLRRVVLSRALVCGHLQEQGRQVHVPNRAGRPGRSRHLKGLLRRLNHECPLSVYLLPPLELRRPAA